MQKFISFEIHLKYLKILLLMYLDVHENVLVYLIFVKIIIKYQKKKYH